MPPSRAHEKSLISDDDDDNDDDGEDEAKYGDDGNDNDLIFELFLSDDVTYCIVVL